MSDRAKINMIFRVNCGKAGEKIMCESIVGVLIGAVIGGIVSLLICWLTIRANNKNIRWERFVAFCKEFETKESALADANVQPSDEIGTSIQQKDLSDIDKEKILFLLAEIESIIEKERTIKVGFFNVYSDLLRNVLFLSEPGRMCFESKLQLNIENGKSIYNPIKTGTPQNKVYSKAQKLLLDFAESKKQESKSAKE